MTCFLCDYDGGDHTGPILERAGKAAHRSCLTAYDRGHAAGRDAMLRRNKANASVYLRLTDHRAVRALVAITAVMRTDRIEIRFGDDPNPVAFFDSIGGDALRAMLDELDARGWGKR